ncbi:MAG TPA: division/cell wall cluster transcriptional repressor MraZ [Allosphingosinicella sp.]|jgi:MraZ protein|nr:division/cell wall cluster transcriptional repressor MraZ [Allosphingosinicella sp.]
MVDDIFFSGNALRAVDTEGRTILPPFVLKALERRCGSARVVLGPHETDPCISGYDEAHEAAVYADVERRRLREEERGFSPAAHHARARRAFGAAERAGFDSDGAITLPPMIRRKGRIGALALFVGTGGSFEIWDPQMAREAGGEVLRELVDFALSDGAQATEAEG